MSHEREKRASQKITEKKRQASGSSSCHHVFRRNPLIVKSEAKITTQEFGESGIQVPKAKVSILPRLCSFLSTPSPNKRLTRLKWVSVSQAVGLVSNQLLNSSDS